MKVDSEYLKTIEGLKSEEEIMSTWVNGMTRPIVSIFCITFNHEAYIEDALKGFLNQETKFAFEVLIHDDASTDNTARIIKLYEKKYPNIVKPIYQTKNQYSQGIKISRKFNLPRAFGDYIAFCEGDDYWIDPKKLEKQVSFLNANQDCSLCFHASRVEYFDRDILDSDTQEVKGIKKPIKFTLQDFISSNGLNMRTVSVVIRKDIYEKLPSSFYEAPVGDLPLQLISGLYGSYSYLPEAMTVYRRAVPGSWSENHKSLDWKLKHIEDLNSIYDDFDDYTDNRYHKLIQARNSLWIRRVITAAQADYLTRAQQMKLIKPYLPELIVLNKLNSKIWFRFLLGNKGLRVAKKMRHSVKERAFKL